MRRSGYALQTARGYVIIYNTLYFIPGDINTMKLTGDFSYENNGRRRIILRLCSDETAADTASSLAALFEEPSVILYKDREYILPVAVGRDSERLSEAIGEIRPERIEIGEGRGKCDVFYTVNPGSGDVICYGPIDYDFYKIIIESGLEITF